MSAALTLYSPLAAAACLAPPAITALQQRAALAYPDNAYLQVEWLRAVRVVRASRRGWLLDGNVAKEARRA